MASRTLARSLRVLRESFTQLTPVLTAITARCAPAGARLLDQLPSGAAATPPLLPPFEDFHKPGNPTLKTSSHCSCTEFSGPSVHRSRLDRCVESTDSFRSVSSLVKQPFFTVKSLSTLAPDITAAAHGASPSEGIADDKAADPETHQVHRPTVSELDALFRTKPAPLGTGSNPAVAAKPASGLSGVLLGALGYYGKESQLIRGARALYSQVQQRADDPAFLEAFGLAPSFRATHAMLVLHTWLCLVRLRAEQHKADAAEVGQTIYDLFNHDCEKRVVAAGVTVLVSKWMKELEKNFYGACIAYDNALKPESAKDSLESSLWRNVLAEGESDLDSPEAAAAARALARYVRLELASLSMTGSEAFLTGNISFSPLPK